MKLVIGLFNLFMAIPNVWLAINNIIEGDYGIASLQIVCAAAIILMGVNVILLWARGE